MRVSIVSSVQAKKIGWLFQLAQRYGYAVAIWRLPKETSWHAIIDFSEEAHQAKPFNLNETTKGFVVSPFLNPNLQKTYFIKADWEWDSSQESIEIPTLALLPKKIRQFWQEFQQSEDKPTNIQKIQIKPLDNSAKENYLSLVQKALYTIEKGVFQKVVTSRKQPIHFEQAIDAVQAFQQLTGSYPAAFVSLVSLPQKGCWLGASPEVLISIDAQQIFRTMALAGTQAYQPEKPLSEAVWTQKEIEEQALVSRYIINCFKKVRVREFDEIGPKTVRAGNLLHLRTDFWVDTEAINYPELPDIMLRLLHPTSAVCGMPLQESLDFILENEKYDRQFYSGFLGPVKFDNATQLFVNLRCMQLFEQKAFLYAGGGITIDSQPEKEWQETKMKCQTLINAFSM